MASLMIKFEVNDDLTSEQSTRYIETAIDAIEAFMNSDDSTEEQQRLCDKMLNDWKCTAPPETSMWEKL